MPTTIHTNRAAGGLTRTEAWRNFEIWDLKKRIVMLTHDHPPKNYADVLLGPDYIPPGGFDGTDWPPTTVQRNGLIFNIVYGGKADTGD